MSGEVMLSCICMVITAPMKIEMTITSGMESMPSLVTSSTKRFAYTLRRSGRENTRHTNCQ